MQLKQNIMAVVVKGELEYQYHGKELLANRLSKLDGQWVTVEIKPVAKPKTLEQMGYYFAVILPTVHSQLVSDGHEVMGVPITQDQADRILKHYCAPQESKLKRRMTKEQAGQFIDNCIRWAAMTLGCSIPEPFKERQSA